MLETVRRYLGQWVQAPAVQAVLVPLLAVADRLSSQLLVSGGLVINGAGNTAAKIGSVIYALCNGVLVTKAANTVMAALSGTVTNAKFNVFCFFLDSGGNLTTVMGTEGASLATIVFPQTPVGQACIGFVIINPTGTGPFVGGTTTLDNATVVPNAVYVNTVGAVDPSLLTGN